MQYEAYENKIKKVASVLAIMLRYAVLIISCLVVIIGAVTAVLVLKGTVTSSSMPAESVYGEPVAFEGKAFLSKVSFEFCSEGGEWVTEQPRMPGEYKVRTRTKGSFGSTKYGDETPFVIKKAKLEVSAADSVPYYGEQPLPSVSGIVAGDSLAQVNFLLSSYEAASAAEPQNGKSVLGYAAAVPDAETIKIVNVAGEDVTNAYDISAIEKKIALSGANSYLKIVVEDKDKIYDGVELSWDVYELVEGTLVGEDTIYATFNASILTVGNTPNQPEIVIRNKDGEDVTCFYKKDIEKGTLTVNARPLYIKSGSAEFTYDFATHSCPQYTIEDGTLLDGHELRLKSSTEITDVSTDGNPYLNAQTFEVISGTENVTSCYSIMLGSGELVMHPMKLSAEGENVTFEYDGKTHSFIRNFNINSKTGEVSCSLEKTNASSETLQICDVGEYVLTDIPSIFLNEDRVRVPAQNFDVDQNGAVTITPKKISFEVKDYSHEYNGQLPSAEMLYTMSGTLCEDHTVVVATHADGVDVGEHAFYLEFQVRKKGSGVPSDYVTKNYEITGDFDGTLEVYPRDITVKINDVVKIYDDTADVTSDNGWVVDRLMSDYTLAAEKLYASRIDAGEGTVTVKKEDIVIYDKNLNADTLDNYDINILPGILVIEKRVVTIIAESNEKVYDGTPLTHHVANISGDTPAVVGHTLAPVFLNSSSITEVTKGSTTGVTPNVLDASKTKIIRSSDNKDVTQNYNMWWTDGVLTITQRPISVNTASGSWVYDGKEHSKPELVLSSGKLVSGHFLPSSSQVDLKETKAVTVGEYANTLENIVVYASGNKDVTHNYNITQEEGTLTITQREITIITDSADKIYDTTPLIAPGASVPANSPNKIVTGHIITAVTVDLTDVGSTENTIIGEVNVWDTNGNDVTANYKITEYNYGKLVVNKCPTKIITATAKQAYNGQALSNNRAMLSAETFGAYAIISGNPSITHIGTTKNTCNTSLTRIYNMDGEDITANFDITGYEYGTLTVVQGEEIKVAVYPTTKIYSGKLVQVDLADVTKPIVDNDVFTFDYSSLYIALKDVNAITLENLNAMAYQVRVEGGNSDIEYVVKFVTPNGVEDPDYAVLKIEPKPLEITASSKTFNYKEGAVFASNDFDITRGSLVSGHKIEVFCDGRIECNDDIYDGYSIDNVISSCMIFDKDGNNVSYNYSIKRHNGKLTVEHLD